MLNAPRDRVWEALTTEDGITSWLAVSASVDGCQGGNIEIQFDADQIVTGTITEWDPTSRFAHTWIINGAVPSDVLYSLVPTSGGTELTLVHTGLPDEMCGGYTPGWHAYMARLVAVTEGAVVPEWLTVFEEIAPQYG
ncbi:MAG: SRPBCC domain-containing protein [Acidimicrobiia bacterium]